MARLHKSGDFVGPGEERVARYLEQHLPASWMVICNKELVDPNGTTREVDFIIIGEHVVFVVEEKSWSGPIHGNENGWVLRSGESVPSPIQTAEGNARRLAGLLRSNVPRLRDQVTDLFVFARVLLSGDIHLFVHDARVGEQALRLEGCDEELLRFDRLQGKVISISPLRERIIKSLIGLPDRPTIPRRVGAFDVLENLSLVGGVRTLRARHRDGSVRILKLVPRPVTADAEKREIIENALLREYDALRRLSASGRAPAVDPYFSWDQDQFWVFPIHVLEALSLRADRTAAAPHTDKIWRTLKDAFTALAEVHGFGVIHRALSPDRIHICADGRMAFSDFVLARIEGEQTIAGQVEPVGPEDAYYAPECRVDLGLADAKSDVYSLAASLLFWVTGNEPEVSARVFPSVEAARSDLPTPLVALLNRISTECLVEDERQRPTAAELAPRIQNVHQGSSPSHEAASNGGPRELGLGAVLADQYRILRKLGEGATATTYLVDDLAADALFVLKVIRNPELINRLARAEFKSLMDLHHPSLPRVYDIRPADGPFHLKLEYVPGSPLRELESVYHGNIDACLRVAYQILDALSYLGSRNLIHRDVSPGNILVPDEQTGNAKLIDFGLATLRSDAATVVGTPRYRAPEVEHGGHWTPSCDLYSLAIVLFELLVGRLPYQIIDSVPHKDRLVSVTPEEEARYGKRLLEALLKGASPDPKARFQAAPEFATALKDAAAGQPTVPLQGHEQVNPFVNQLRGAYRNSGIGNADNRGLDTEFARKTYVQTGLDTHLLPRLLTGQYQLVILSGNPGDGKTAFLQRVREQLRLEGAHVESESPAGWRLRLNHRTYAALYDASESHQQKSANTLLNEILQPLRGPDSSDAAYTAAIAVNDGRLFDFFERYGHQSYPWLWSQIRRQLAGDAEDDGRVALVDLKLRALVREKPDTPSIFSRILEEFASEERWETCESCMARLECPIRLNALTLRDPLTGPAVRGRLHTLLLAVHLRRERRPTIRDLRSTLAYLITNDLGCEDIHKERRQGTVPLADPSRFYFNAAFNRSGSPDLLLDEWGQLDPSYVANPRLDRFLHFHRRRDQATAVSALFQEPASRPDLNAVLDSSDPKRWLATMKRRYFFEAAPQPEHLAQWDLPGPQVLLPYWYHSEFTSALEGSGDDGKLLRHLLRGIARADGVPEHGSQGGLALRVTESSTDELVVIKVFPTEEFRLRRPRPGGLYAEGVPDQLILEHRGGSPTLTVGLDLFEFLYRSADGFLPGSEEQRALVEDLATFKNSLLARPTQEVAIVEGGRRIHHVRVYDHKIRREGTVS